MGPNALYRSMNFGDPVATLFSMTSTPSARFKSRLAVHFPRRAPSESQERGSSSSLTVHDLCPAGRVGPRGPERYCFFDLAGTTSTLQGAWPMTRCTVLPIISRVSPVRPWLPMTMVLTFLFFASATMSL